MGKRDSGFVKPQTTSHTPWIVFEGDAMITESETSYKAVIEQLKQACADGRIKQSTCTNAVAWLQPSFAAVVIDGERVGDVIFRLVANGAWQELDDRFFTVNRFGTAGVRGRLGIGTALFNKIILGMGVEAHSRYIERAYAENGSALGREKAVILAYDSRRGSYDPNTGSAGFLVQEAASIYAAHGIKVYLFDSVAPTPELSFAITELDHIHPYAGGVFTASHNPSSDNGFKPYDFYGGQVVHTAVQDVADRITDYAEVRRLSYDEAIARGLIEVVGHEIDAAYIEKENQNAIWVDERGYFRPDKIDTGLRVVFSSLNGTAQRLLPRVLARRGFDVSKNLLEVPFQCVPDGNFPTCPKPNPEEKPALHEALQLANTMQADILIATDPDADRLGVGVKVSDKERSRLEKEDAYKDGYYLLTGNQQLVLLADYILGQLAERDKGLPANSVISKTLVSTDLAKEIADRHGVMTVEPLVGFKYLGEKLALYAAYAWEKGNHSNNPLCAAGRYTRLSRRQRMELLSRYSLCCLFGGEESYGSLIGDYVKDKDAITIGAMFVEMAGFYRTQRKTLFERLEEIYREYGYAREETISLSYEGASGNDIIRAIMARLRSQPLKRVAGKEVIAALDYLPSPDTGRRECRDPSGKKIFDDAPPADRENHTGYYQFNGVSVPLFWHGDYRIIGQKAQLPVANMILYVLNDGSKIVVRPSGTEPKIKFYVLARGIRGPGQASPEDKQRVDAFFSRAKDELKDFADAIASTV